VPHLLFGALAVFAVGCAELRARKVPLIGNAQTVVRDVLACSTAPSGRSSSIPDVFAEEDVVTGPKSGDAHRLQGRPQSRDGREQPPEADPVVFDPDASKSKVAVKAVVGIFRWTSATCRTSVLQDRHAGGDDRYRGTTIEYDRRR